MKVSIYMNDELIMIIKPFKYLLIITIIEILVCFTFFTNLYSNYDKNLFEISLNGKLMNCYYTEKYNKDFFIHASSEGYNSVENRINKIEMSNKIQLNVDEYEVYYKSGGRKANTNGWLRQDNLEYKKVNSQDKNIQIKRMNKIIYDGKYISNLSSYINEEGRYYIHIYSTRKDGLFTSVKTHISFNVIVGGGKID